MNKYNKFIIMFCIYLMIPLISEGRISETIKMCESRYGSGMSNIGPLLTGKNTLTMTFSYQGWVIRIGFYRKIAIIIQYIRLQKIEDAELQAIMQAYQTDPWEEGSFETSAGVQKGWKSNRGYVAYMTGILNGTLTIEWPEMFKKLEFEKNGEKKFTKVKQLRF